MKITIKGGPSVSFKQPILLVRRGIRPGQIIKPKGIYRRHDKFRKEHE